MYSLLIATAVVLALAIIGLVLIQHGRGADTGAAFGGGASGSVFGSRGSTTFLSRATATAVALFFANCLALAWVVKHMPVEPTLMQPTATEAFPAPEQPEPVVPENVEVDPAAEIPE